MAGEAQKINTTTVMWGLCERWEIVVPMRMGDDYAAMPLQDFHDMYGGLLYGLNPEIDDADVRRELVECIGPEAENFTAGRCFDYLASLISQQMCRERGVTV